MAAGGDAVWQLDLRRGRRSQCGAQRGRAGLARENAALRGNGCLLLPAGDHPGCHLYRRRCPARPEQRVHRHRRCRRRRRPAHRRLWFGHRSHVWRADFRHGRAGHRLCRRGCRLVQGRRWRYPAARGAAQQLCTQAGDGGATMSTVNTDTLPLLEVQNVSKYFGSVIALKDISMKLFAGQVMCLLGDNGAVKSTLIKILSGVHRPSEGQYLIEGKEVHFSSPRDALNAGIATVYQDLAMIPLMGISRNFFLGSEPTKGWGPFRRFDVNFANRVTREELAKIGIQVRDTAQPVGTLSGGERQSVAIARAVYFGAKVLILDEPTAALGVKEAGIVLRYIAQARAKGLGVIFITHNPHHAYPIGDHFTLLNRGRSMGSFAKSEISREEITAMMAGGEELETLSFELAEFARTDATAGSSLAEAAREFEQEAEVLHEDQHEPRQVE